LRRAPLTRVCGIMSEFGTISEFVTIGEFGRT
jgi:hypothetical protein